MNERFGGKKHRGYFQGWYFKQQNGRDTVALIPAFHTDHEGRASASLQVITGTGTCRAEFPASAAGGGAQRLPVRLGHSVFSPGGCVLDLRTEELSLRGRLRYGPLTPPAGDIMGPFRFVPFLECRHSVFSLRHTVCGTVLINGTPTVFQNGSGYLEGDRGVSFPRRYLWTQCLHGEDSVMLSAAEIPLCGGVFPGCVGFVYTGGREYRIATYRGARILDVSGRSLLLRQGALTVGAELLKACFLPLRAPHAGGMTRTIRESAACRVRYTFVVQGRTVLDFVSEQAGFETGGALDKQTEKH